MKSQEILHSKTTYKSETNAAKLGKAARKENYKGTHELPSGRFCYTFTIQGV